MAETLEDLRRAAERLGNEGFCARYPHPFLVRLDERGGRDEPTPWAFAEPEDTRGGPRPPLPAAGRLARVHDLVKSSGKGGRDRLTVGRDAANDVVVSERSISRTHAQLRVGTGRDWRILDATSSNGVRVNGKRIPPRALQPLRSGDVVTLADVAFLFLWPDDLLGRLPALCLD